MHTAQPLTWRASASRALLTAALVGFGTAAWAAETTGPSSADSEQARHIVPALSATQAATMAPEMVQLIDKGRMVAIAADCAACHTVPESGQPFAGNYRLGSPLGEIVATNITPSKTHGIGNYSEEDFSRAVREGVRKDGAHLYPAMPYDAYARMTDEDLHALYTYTMQAVPAIDTPTDETALPFPFNIRMSMAFWNALFVPTKGSFKEDSSKTPEWNRGAYLTEVLAHCTSCHTPRNALMAIDEARPLAGGYVGAWYAPNISSDPASGIGGWTKEELVQYMQVGHVEGKGQAAGGMAEAIQNSLQFLPKEDLEAIATYVKDAKPMGGAQQGKPVTERGAAFNAEDELRGQTPYNHQDKVTSGMALFSANCASCHQANGAGTPDQAYPSLFSNTATGRPEHANLVATILFGVERKVGDKEVLMPRFDEKSFVDPLTNEEVAEISNYVLTHYGTPGEKVTPQYVQQVREGNAGPTPLLIQARPLMAPAMVVGLLIVLGVIVWLLRRRKKR